MSSTDERPQRPRAVARRPRTACAPSRSSTCALILVLPDRHGLLPHLRERAAAAFWTPLSDPAAPCTPCYLTLVIAAIVVPLNTVFGVFCALLLVRRPVPGQGRSSARSSTCRSRSRRSSSASRWCCVYGRERLVRRLARGRRHPGHLRLAGHGAGDDLRLAAVRGARGRCPVLQRDRHRAGAGGATRSGRRRWQTFWRITLPAIRWGLTYGVVLTDGPRARRVRRREHRQSGKIAGRTDRPCTLHVEEQFRAVRPRSAPTRRRSCSPLIALVIVLAHDPAQAAREAGR